MTTNPIPEEIEGRAGVPPTRAIGYFPTDNEWGIPTAASQQCH